jgi:hypothetical protein
LKFSITGSFDAGLGYNADLFPTQIRWAAIGTAFTFGSSDSVRAGDRRLDREAHCKRHECCPVQFNLAIVYNCTTQPDRCRLGDCITSPR